MMINIKETTMIRPAQDLPNQSIWLSSLDTIHERNHVPIVYFYKSNDCSISFDANKVLKEALSKVLIPFHTVAGRLGRDDNGRLEINCNGEGVLFIEAETDSTIDDLGEFMLNVDIDQLLPSIDYSKDISSFPLLGIKATTFKCGGISLGIRICHTLADCEGVIHFVNTWCDITRGLPIKISPFMDRTILRSQGPPNPKFELNEFEKVLNRTSTTTAQSYSKEANCTTEIFIITSQQLHILKTKVNNFDGKTKYSSYQILTAYIWRCICKALGLSDNQSTKLLMPVDGRSRLHPSLPPGYFGNVVFMADPVALSGDILSERLSDTVERINKAIKQMDDQYFRSTIDYIEQFNNKNIKLPVTEIPISRYSNLIITSWMWLPFYDADFGMGKPLYMRPGDPGEGNGHIIPTPSSDVDGNWLLNISLDKDHMKSFKSIFMSSDFW